MDPAPVAPGPVPPAPAGRPPAEHPVARGGHRFPAALQGLVLVAVLGAVAVTVRPADLARLGRFLLDEPAWALGAAAAYAAAFALRTLAWQLLLPRRLPLATLGRLTLAANLVNHLAPGKLGEVARMALGARWGLPRAVAVVSVIQARAVDTAALLAVAGVALAASLGAGRAAGAAGAGGAGLRPGSGPGSGPALPGAWDAAALPAAVLVGVATPVLLAVAARQAPRLARRWPRLEGAAQALAAVPGRRLAAAWVLSAASWPLEAGMLAVVTRGLEVRLEPAALVTITLVAVAGQVLAVTPGGLGTYEANMTAMLYLYGVPPATGFQVALLTHLAKYAFAVVAGLEPAWRLAGGPALLLRRVRAARGPAARPAAEGEPGEDAH